MRIFIWNIGYIWTLFIISHVRHQLCRPGYSFWFLSPFIQSFVRTKLLVPICCAFDTLSLKRCAYIISYEIDLGLWSPYWWYKIDRGNSLVPSGMKPILEPMLTHPDTKVHGPTWDSPGSCRPQVSPILASWTLLSGASLCHHIAS